jgi:hypothetical protein
MAIIEIKCFECSENLKFNDFITRRDECTKCRADVRVCKNCRFYDAKVYNECKETAAEPVREKNRSNLCDHFSPGTQNSGNTSREDLLKAAEALFKK